MDHSGVSNTAVASAALEFNTFGEANTAIGAAALEYNTRGAANIAIGLGAVALVAALVALGLAARRRADGAAVSATAGGAEKQDW